MTKHIFYIVNKYYQFTYIVQANSYILKVRIFYITFEIVSIYFSIKHAQYCTNNYSYSLIDTKNNIDLIEILIIYLLIIPKIIKDFMDKC